ncbi:DUF805 domain-containing protein [Lewinella sp. IMCC34183]|uniref:DUF805 domain-containing protein n=1 Tax=Lewinella sp. IMCC34183 TaxID=2248762 RepID=UPI000E269A0D|nr:hypothetical protein [Lewinella sp. IMCC34183]
MTLPPPVRNIWGAYRGGWRRYADFRGRSRLSEYLGFFAVNLLIGLLLRMAEGWSGSGFFFMMGLFYGLAALLPGLAITVRLIRYGLSSGQS